MSITRSEPSTATLHVTNIGGIDEADVSFSSGCTILAGRNATNRSSLLQAIMAVCGSTNVSVKGDADKATVELTIGDDTYTRTLRRQNGTVVAEGTPYLEDPTLADLFAFLLESNEARRAVTRSDNLRELIMRPVDTDEIQAEIDRLIQRRRTLEEELSDIEDSKDQLPELVEEQNRLKSEIESKREELTKTEDELAELDANVEESREQKDEFEQQLDDLRNKRSSLEDIRYDIDTERESLQSLQQEQTELQSKQEELPESPAGNLDEVESHIDRLRTQKQRLDTEINELHRIIQFNEEMLSDADTEILEALNKGETDGNLTDQLLDDEMVTCWTCGSDVKGSQIETTVDRLRELSQSKRADANDIQNQIDGLKEKQQSLQQSRDERERIDRRLSQTADEIEQTKDRLNDLQARRDELTDDIETIEATIEDQEEEQYSEVLDVHKQANQLEYEIGRLESDFERTKDKIATIEERIQEADDIQDELEVVREEITDLRTKIEQIEQEAISEFNGHMDAVLDHLDYQNLDRIWLERLERDVREGRRTVTKSIFELHIIRSTAAGTTYEDTIEHLSESEREVTGLIFALAGYLAHEVYETLPFMLLDSLEAIDAGRIAKLLDYLDEYSDYLVVALLPEDAADIDYQIISEF